MWDFNGRSAKILLNQKTIIRKNAYIISIHPIV